MHSRFTALQNYSEEDLEKIRQSTAVIIGLGATGSVMAENLARHGVNLIIIDRDYLEEKDVYSSNIYTPSQCEKALPKAYAAEEKLSSMTDVEAYVESLGPENTDIMDEGDIIIDGSDNLQTRLLMSEYAQKNSVPWIYTAAVAEKGYSMLFSEKCFNCYFEDTDPSGLETCEISGVMREISGQTALKSSYKAVKYLSGKKVEEKMDMVPSGDVLSFESSECPVCRGEKYETLNKERSTVAVCGENKYQVETGVEGLKEKVKAVSDEEIADNKYLVRSVVEGDEITVFRDGRAIVRARDAGHAESKVSELLGV